LPIRNPVFHQSPRLPLYKEKLRILTKLQKVESNTKHIYLFLLPRRSNFDITDVKVTKKACNERRKYETYSCLSPVFFASFLPHYLLISNIFPIFANA